LNHGIDIGIYEISDYGYATQIWEYYFSFKQHESYPNHPKIKITFRDMDDSIHSDDISILHVSYSDISMLSGVEKFDLILIDNNVEHLSVGSDDAIDFVKVNSNAYFLVGSFIHPEYRFYERCITMPRDWLNCRNWYTNPKVFVNYNVNTSDMDKKDNLLYIGGELRSYRKYIIDMIGDSFEVMQNSDTLVCTKDAVNGDQDDQNFTDMCNNLYDINEQGNEMNKFYNMMEFGLHQRPSGRTTISYLMLSEYSKNKCIVYSESAFTNNEIYPTEKTWKCVVSKTHWIMFAGKNSYRLMSDMGIRSILELVPGGIGFDSISEHDVRFEKQMESIKYLNNHLEVFDTDEASEILISNYEEFLTGNKFIMPMVNKIDSLIENYI